MNSEVFKYDITWIGLLEIKNRKVLMTREKGKTLFQLPGGGQDANESYLETLSREVSEELVVKISNPKVYDEFILPGRNEKAYIKFIIYTADIKGEVKCGSDIEEIKWINSNYSREMIDIGNPTKLILIPKLLSQNLID